MFAPAQTAFRLHWLASRCLDHGRSSDLLPQWDQQKWIHTSDTPLTAVPLGMDLASQNLGEFKSTTKPLNNHIKQNLHIKTFSKYLKIWDQKIQPLKLEVHPDSSPGKKTTINPSITSRRGESSRRLRIELPSCQQDHMGLEIQQFGSHRRSSAMIGLKAWRQMPNKQVTFWWHAGSWHFFVNQSIYGLYKYISIYNYIYLHVT